MPGSKPLAHDNSSGFAFAQEMLTGESDRDPPFRP